MTIPTLPLPARSSSTPSEFPPAWLSANPWHADVPASLRQLTPWQDSAAFALWQQHLSQRNRPPQAAWLADQAESALFWAAGFHISPLVELLATDGCGAASTTTRARPIGSVRSGRKQKQRRQAGTAVDLLRPWLAEESQRPPDVSLALECLAWCEALPRLAAELPAELWWALLERLVEVAHDALAHSAECRSQNQRADTSSPAENRPVESDTDTPTRSAPNQTLVPWQLLGVELPLALRHQLPELAICHSLGQQGEANYHESWQLLEAGDTNHPGIRALWTPADVPLLAACWCRCEAALSGLPGAGQSQRADPGPSAVVAVLQNLHRPDGTLAGLPGPSRSAEINVLLQAAQQALGNAETRRLTAPDLPAAAAPPHAVASKPMTTHLSRPRGHKHLHPTAESQATVIPGSCQAKSGWALLRSDWGRTSVCGLWDWSHGVLRGDLSLGKETLCAGTWTLQVGLAGRTSPVSPGPWQFSWWYADAEADYLGLHAQGPGDLRIERELLLARRDRMLLLCDSVLTSTSGPIELVQQVPLAAQTQFEPAAETREGYLTTRQRRALLLPVALPEWRADRRGGTLESVDQASSRYVEQRTVLSEGTGCVPLWLDLEAKRQRAMPTWRQLTIAEDRRTVPTNQAVGYRVQIKKQQWLFYRSLTEPANRTLLGANLVSHSMLGRFGSDGVNRPIVEIE